MPLPTTIWANTLDEIEKYEEAIAAFQKAIQLNPQFADCLLLVWALR